MSVDHTRHSHESSCDIWYSVDPTIRWHLDPTLFPIQILHLDPTLMTALNP